MVSRVDWTSEECDALLTAYFDMADKQRRNEPFVKRQIIAALQATALSNRSRQSIEYKLRNVSAVLDDRRLPYVAGYVPASNAQQLLRERVDVFLASGGNAFDPLPGNAPTSFDPAGAVEDRERVWANIRERRGQQSFRASLIQAYEGRCQISGCSLVAVLEAAHVVPYGGPDFNNPTNGLLLRADLHTLFDLNLIGIEPDTLVVHLTQPARTPPYEQFEGSVMRITERLWPSSGALRARWKEFEDARGF